MRSDPDDLAAGETGRRFDSASRERAATAIRRVTTALTVTAAAATGAFMVLAAHETPSHHSGTGTGSQVGPGPNGSPSGFPATSGTSGSGTVGSGTVGAGGSGVPGSSGGLSQPPSTPAPTLQQPQVSTGQT